MSPTRVNAQTLLRLTLCSRSGKWLERLIFIGLLFVGLGVCGNASSQSAASFETPDYLNQRGLGLINASEAYRLGYTGKGVTLGIVDSGIEPLHPKFSGQLTGGYDFMRNQPITPTSGMDSGVGHGTHVSAIMAGRRDGQEMHGVAFDASFLMARYGVFGINPEDDEEEDEEGDETASYTAAASFLDQAFSRSWNYYADKNIGIINNSIGVNVCDRGEAGSAIQPCNVLDFGLRSKGDTDFFFYADELFPQSIAALHAMRDTDKLMVFATGNEEQLNPDFLAAAPYYYPGLKDNWLAVTSVDVDTGEISSFSNACGVAKWWCMAAPGGYAEEEGILSAYFKGGYINYFGTSMAAPHVTGTAALVKEAFPFFNASQLQQTLLTTATDLIPEDGTRFDIIYGWGLLNAAKAVRGPALFISDFDVDTQGYDATFSNDIGDLFGDPAYPAQRGALVKRGAGTLTLSGINRYTGTTTVEDGTLQIAGINNTGDTIVNGGILAVTEHAQLNSPRNTVNGGRVVVNGTLAANSTTTVNPGGSLGGSGYVGDLVNKGTVAPGNSIGTLNVLGNYTATSGSVLAIEVDNNNAYDILKVSGTATLDSGSVLELQGGLFRQGVAYNFLQAPTVINNGLRIDSPPLLFLTPVLQAAGSGNGLSLTFNRNSIAFARYTHTANQASVANALDGFSAAPPSVLSTLYDDVLNARSDVFPGLMDQLGGELHASVQSGLFNQTGLWTDVSTRRLNSLLTTGYSVHKPVWVTIERQWSDMKGRAGTADARYHTNGLYLGGDVALGNDVYMGAAFGYHDTRSYMDERSSRANIDSYTLALYGGTRWQTSNGNAIHWRVSGAWTHQAVDTRRHNITVGGDQTLSADYDGQQIYAYTELGYALPLADTTALEPFARLGWMHQRMGSLTETGGPAALYSRGQNNDITSMTLGVRSYSEFSISSDSLLRLTGEIAWGYASGDLTPRREMQFDRFRDARFIVQGNPTRRNALHVALGGEVDMGKQAVLGLNYSGKFGGGNTTNAGSLYVNVRF